MTAIKCPVCGCSVNANATGCPECGANPALPAEEARSDLLARGLPLPPPPARIRRHTWSRRRRLAVAVGALVVIVVLLAPQWLGYFGPRVAAYATTWRPWRTHITLSYEHDWPQRCTMEVQYRDPWPGQARTPGWQVDFLTLRRYRSWLPWVVSERGSGP